ncbi:hypothetical protein [Mangrovibacterium diazotrophicum]|uniref:Uncharacterized protein n=1 Tax=Mangrovibacterium diazotrophicum TaxID=1261403 RepID=A0A419W4T0_9BACT|nr:hypothetical protein [Mangrovibacterium diazotrophicum]RKD90452.1 hypothetical protein BC643_0792 [Mangrovibacterium diazotrophicum]
MTFRYQEYNTGDLHEQLRIYENPTMADSGNGVSAFSCGNLKLVSIPKIGQQILKLFDQIFQNKNDRFLQLLAHTYL